MPSTNKAQLSKIAHILDQPPNAVPAAINALLRRNSALSFIEAKGIFQEAESLLTRCLQTLQGEAMSTSYEVTEPFVSSTCQLLQAAFAVSPDAHTLGLETFFNSEVLFHCLSQLFHWAIHRNQATIGTQVELLQVADYLCEGMQTKEKCGELFLTGLQELLIDPQRSGEYRLQREVATVLINMIKCSKINKERLIHLDYLASALTNSIDFFFQLQMVELLFRLTRQNKQLLSEEFLPNLPIRIRTGLSELVNDATLLEKLISLLEGYNEERKPTSYILKFLVQRVDIGMTTLCAQTKVYFSPEHFVVLIPGASADNITITYFSLRSVKLLKDSRIVLKLAEGVPPKIEDRITLGKEGEDCITLFTSAPVLADFKRSSIHQWISQVLKSKYSNGGGGAKNKKESSAIKYDPKAQAANSILKRSKRGHQQTLEEEEEEEGENGETPQGRGDVEYVMAPSPYEGGCSPAGGLQLHLQPSASTHPITIGKSIAGDEQGMERQNKRRRFEKTEVRSTQQLPQLYDPHSPPVAERKKSRSLHQNGARNNDTTESLGTSHMTTTTTSSHQSVQEKMLSHISSHSNPNATAEDAEVDQLIRQLKSVIDEKINGKRLEVREILTSTMEILQQQLNESRAATRSFLQEYTCASQAQIDSMRSTEETVRSKVVDLVHQLNTALQELKNTGNFIKDQVAVLDIECCNVVDGLKSNEDIFLSQFKDTVEAEMMRLEKQVNEGLMAASNGNSAGNHMARYLTTYVSRQMEENGI